MSPNEYKQKLIDTFGYDCTAEKPKGLNKVSKHKCTCGATYMARPSTMLHRNNAMCLACNKELALRKHNEEEFRAALPKYNMVCLEYTANHKLGTFACIGCGTIIKKRPNDIIKSKGHCKKKIPYSPSQILQLKGLKEVGKSLECLKCGTTFQYDTNNAIITECPTCVGKSNLALRYIEQNKSCTPSVKPYYFKNTCVWPDFLLKRTPYIAVDIKDFVLRKYKEYKGFGLIIYSSTYDKYIEVSKGWQNKTEEQVWAEINIKYCPKIVMLGIDPGTASMGWSVSHVDKQFKPKLAATGLFRNALKTIDPDINHNLKMFEHELRHIIETYGVTHITAERFQSRKMGGTTIECVNMMLGIIGSLAEEMRNNKNGLHVLFVTPANWKNEWNRYSDLEAFYKTTTVEDHQCDSLGQGLYGAYRWFHRKPFENIKQLEKSLAQQLGKVNI